MAKYGRETNDADIRARQQRDLDKATKMMEEDRDPETRKKYTADQLKERLSFMTDAMREADRQRKYDAEVEDKPKREAANEFKRETRGGKAPEASGSGPKLTFLTPERLAKSRRSMEGSDYKKGGKIKKYDSGGSVLTPEQRAEMRQRRDDMAKEKVSPPRGTTKKEADIFKEGIKPPKDDEGAVKKAKGGSIKSASARADGIAIRGKTRA